MTLTELQSALAKVPRVPLITLPTPLDELTRLGPRLGIRLLLKREDLTALALGGNKSRMFEYLMADAQAKQADVVVGGAAAQSNYCRQLAAACAVLGLELHLFLREVRGKVDREPQGNLLLDLLFGANVRILEVSPTEQRASLRHLYSKQCRCQFSGASSQFNQGVLVVAATQSLRTGTGRKHSQYGLP